MVYDLFTAWVATPALLPPSYAGRIGDRGGGHGGTESAPRVVADYIAGMTDSFILQQHARMGKEL